MPKVKVDIPESEQTTKVMETVQSEKPKKKRRLFRKFFLLLLLVVMGIGLFLPQILSNSAVREKLTSTFLKDFHGQIDIKSADLAWWKPVEISSLTMLDEQGGTLAKVESAKISTPLWRMFWPDDKPLVLEITKPEVNLVIGKYGTNWQHLFTQKENQQTTEEFSWPEYRHNSEPIRLKVIDGIITVKDKVSNRTVESRNITMNLIKSDKLVTGDLQGKTKLILESDSQLPAGNIQASFQIALANKKATAGDVQGKIENTPLELIQPWLKQVAPHLHLTAEAADANFDSKWTGDFKTGLKLQLTGELSANKVDMQSTEWLPDRKLNASAFTGKFEIDNTLPNTPGNYDVSFQFDQCKFNPLKSSQQLPAKKDPFAKPQAQQVSSAVLTPVAIDMGTLVVQSSGSIDGLKQQIDLKKCSLKSKPCNIKLDGTITNYLTTPELDLNGEATGDIMPFLTMTMPDLQQTLQIKRLTPEEFAVKGTLPAGDKKAIVKTDAEKPVDNNSATPLTAVAKWSWDKLESYGVASHKGTLWTKYEGEQLRIVPTNVPIGRRGEFVAKAVLDMRNENLLLNVEPGPVLKNVEFNESMTKTWLRYVNPLFADATDLEGEFSLSTKGTQIDFNAVQPKELQGTLQIHSCKLGPGPAFRKATAPLAGFRAIAKPNRPAPGFLKSGANWVQLPQQNINFLLKNERVYHDQLVFQTGNVQIVSSGSVGLDQTLNSTITVPLNFIKGNDKPLLGMLKNQKVEVAIRGTLEKPVVDASKMGNMTKQLAPAAIDGLLKGLLDKRRRKN